MKNGGLYRDLVDEIVPLLHSTDSSAIFLPKSRNKGSPRLGSHAPLDVFGHPLWRESGSPLNEGTNEHIFLKARARKQSQWRGLLSFRDDWLVCKYVFLLFSLGPSSNFLSRKSTGCLTGKRSIYTCKFARVAWDRCWKSRKRFGPVDHVKIDCGPLYG